MSVQRLKRVLVGRPIPTSRDQHERLSRVTGLAVFIPARWWQHLLHNQTALLIKGAMLFRKNVIVTDVPYHLKH